MGSCPFWFPAILANKSCCVIVDLVVKQRFFPMKPACICLRVVLPDDTFVLGFRLQLSSGQWQSYIPGMCVNRSTGLKRKSRSPRVDKLPLRNRNSRSPALQQSASQSVNFFSFINRGVDSMWHRGTCTHFYKWLGPGGAPRVEERQTRN